MAAQRRAAHEIPGAIDVVRPERRDPAGVRPTIDVLALYWFLGAETGRLDPLLDARPLPLGSRSPALPGSLARTMTGTAHSSAACPIIVIAT
jgi:hypothetical protein